MKKRNKRYFFSIVEEGIMNPKFFGFRGGRVEIYDRRKGKVLQHYEARFLIPEEFFEDFNKTFDFKESNRKVFIDWKM